MPWRTSLVSGLRAAIRVPKAMRYPVSVVGVLVLVATVWLAGRMLYTAQINGDTILLIALLLAVGLTMVATGNADKVPDRSAGGADAADAADEPDGVVEKPCLDESADTHRATGGEQ